MQASEHVGEEYRVGSGLEITISPGRNSRAGLRLVGELDVASASSLRACLEQQVARGRRYLRIDLAGVTFVDAAGIAELVRAHHDLLGRRGTLVITAMSRRCRHLVELVALDQVLLIVDQTEGMRSFKAPARTSMLIGISAK